MLKAVFLDRDGVLNIPEFRNGRSFAPKNYKDFQLYQDASESVDLLKKHGFLIIVVTNQPDVGAGIVLEKEIQGMHSKLSELTRIDDIEVCYETKDQATERRKPGSKMLFDSSEKWNIDLSVSYMVGDRNSDIVAGNNAGCTSLFIDHGYTFEEYPKDHAVKVGSLKEATDWIVNHSKRK